MTTFGVVLAIHIVFAVACAIALWPPALAEKGGPFHRRSGRIYFALLLLATSTSVLVTALRYRIGPQALGVGGASPLDAMAGDAMRYRMFIAFLVFIALATASAAGFGVRSLRRSAPARSEALGHLLVALLGFAAVGAGVMLVDLPMVAVGTAGGLMCTWQARVALRPPAAREQQVRDHFTGMICSGIGAYSALAVVVGNRVAPTFFHSKAGLLIWLVPTLIGLPILLRLRFTR